MLEMLNHWLKSVGCLLNNTGDFALFAKQFKEQRGKQIIVDKEWFGGTLRLKTVYEIWYKWEMDERFKAKSLQI